MIVFLDLVVDLWASCLSSSWLEFFFYPVFCLAFIATVPAIIRSFITWR